MTDLNFSRLQAGLPDLDFGSSDTPPVYLDLSLNASLVSGGLVAALSVSVDNSVSRGPGVLSAARYQQTDRAGCDASAHHEKPINYSMGTNIELVNALSLQSDQSSAWGGLSRRPEYSGIACDRAEFSDSLSAISWADLSPTIRPASSLGFMAGEARTSEARVGWITLYKNNRPVLIVRDDLPIHSLIDAGISFAHAAQVNRDWQALWESCGAPEAGVSPRPVDPQPPVVDPYIATSSLAFVARQAFSTALEFAKGQKPAAIIIPAKDIYMTINTQSVVLEETGTAIDARNVQLSIDDQSWTWSWSADVPASFEDVLTAPVDELIPLVITINGFSVSVLASLPVRDRVFAKSTLKISGQGRSAWLADPYADKISRSNSSLLTAQQLMANVLSENGVSLGWDIDWKITDWSIPADVWSHTGTAIEACEEIAAAAGGYIQSHPTSQVLQVLPKYPAMPWDWDSITPDFDLPEDVCTVESTETIDKPRYNSVVVSGQADGVRCHVTRAGSDGGRVAPMVIDSLITHLDAGRQRGGAVLADSGRQKIITLSLPVLAETGPILPGKFLRYRESGKVHIGLTRGLVISSDFPRVRQQIKVETHVL